MLTRSAHTQSYMQLPLTLIQPFRNKNTMITVTTMIWPTISSAVVREETTVDDEELVSPEEDEVDGLPIEYDGRTGV